MSVSLSGRGSMVPNEDCYCEIDPEVKDKWGIPVLRFHWKWSNYEINEVRHMRENFRAILETLGGTVMRRAAAAGRVAAVRQRLRRQGNRSDDGRQAPRRQLHRQATAAPARSPRRRRFRTCRWALAAASFTRSAASAWATIHARACVNRFCQAHDVQERLLSRWRSLRQSWRQESDAHDHRVGLANRRVPGGGNEERQCLRSAGAMPSRASPRRSLPREPSTASDALEAHTAAHQAAAATGGVYKPAALSAEQFRALERLVDLIVPEDQRQAGRVAHWRASLD